VPEKAPFNASGSVEIQTKPAARGVFCSVGLLWQAGPLFHENETAEDVRPVCWASQTVKVTVNAAINPVHLLRRTLVTLGLAKYTK